MLEESSSEGSDSEESSSDSDSQDNMVGKSCKFVKSKKEVDEDNSGSNMEDDIEYGELGEDSEEEGVSDNCHHQTNTCLDHHS